MFHVERTIKNLISKGIAAIIVLIFTLCACNAARERQTIPDYLILENGKTAIGTKPLNAFIFESTRRDILFQKFLVSRYKSVDLNEKEFDITIDGQHFQMLVYDNPELEKYFDTSKFIITNLQPETEATVNIPKFIAISVISANNEDCLSEQSIFHNITINYLKTLKDDFLKL